MPRGRPSDVPDARARFRENDRYRAEREWLRYEGTPQRELYREIRARFFERHAADPGWAIDLGSGPGRFGPQLSRREGTRLVALDIGRAMLRLLSERWPRSAGSPALPDRVLGDALAPPFAPGAFSAVTAFGNLVGFAGTSADSALEATLALLAPGGTVRLEIAPGAGERSRYLHRLPSGAVARLLRSPPPAVLGRVQREGFDPMPRRRAAPGEFRRWDPVALAGRLEARGFTVEEILAVAPALGADPERLRAARADPKSWTRLLELEEALGRSRERWPRAAAVLLAARHQGGWSRPSEG